MPTACACFEVMQTLWLAPFVLDPAAMLRAESTAIMDIVSWLSLLTPCALLPSRATLSPLCTRHTHPRHASFNSQQVCTPVPCACIAGP